MKFKYPIYKESKSTGLIVKFTSLREGVVVYSDTNWEMGKKSENWIEHTDANWKDTDFKEKPKFKYYIKGNKNAT